MNPSRKSIGEQGEWRADIPMEISRTSDISSSSLTDESIRSDDTISKLADAMAHALKNVSLPGPSRMIRGEVVPIFDPTDINQNVEDWCNKVDEIREIFHWSDDVTIFNAISKLHGLANVWYKGLKSVKFTWNEWKEKLRRAFPAQRDYNALLEEMMARKKKPNETFAQYFYEKQALLNACKIQGSDAVSCIIAGIREIHIRTGAKAANFDEPEDLFNYLRSLNDDVTTYVPRVPVTKPYNNHKRKYDSFKKSSMCFICNKPGHISKYCQSKGAEKRDRKCFLCQEIGHLASACPKRRKTHESTK